jgi:hypothetical protein
VLPRKASSLGQQQRQSRTDRPTLIAEIVVEVVGGLDVAGLSVAAHAEDTAFVDADRQSSGWNDTRISTGFEGRTIGATPARFEVIAAVAIGFLNAAD